MPIRRVNHPKAHAMLCAWLTGFAACVQRRDFAEGRAYFHAGAYCFGSYAVKCESLRVLVSTQWRKVWPNIAKFDFDLKSLRYTASRDGRWICGMALWRSVGYDSHGRPFKRNGRVTVLLTHGMRDGRWRAVHTHYSLNPGTAQTTVRHR